jgi:hypothetical protein
MNALDEGIAFEQKYINPETHCNSFNVAFFYVIKDSMRTLICPTFLRGSKSSTFLYQLNIQERAIKYRDPLFYS